MGNGAGPNRTIQVVAAVMATVIIAVTALLVARDPGTEYVLAVIGSSFTLVAALLGVHYGFQFANGNGNGK
jgi:hypothetical protein